MTTLAHLDTLAALVAVESRQANITRMQSRMDLSNHACATAAQFPEYQAVMPNGGLEPWRRFQGW